MCRLKPVRGLIERAGRYGRPAYELSDGGAEPLEKVPAGFGWRHGARGSIQQSLAGRRDLAVSCRQALISQM